MRPAQRGTLRAGTLERGPRFLFARIEWFRPVSRFALWPHFLVAGREKKRGEAAK